MEYEVWHVATDELVGRIELAQAIPEEPGAKVSVKVKGTIVHKQLGAFNAIEMLVCRMRGKTKDEKYYALETNLPHELLPRLEGFTPHIRVPRLWEIFKVNRSRL